MKISRNDSCPCGNNKKYKKCCLQKNIKTGYVYVGQDYAEDKENVEVVIKYCVPSAVVFRNFDIDLPNNLHMRQSSGQLNISIDRTISKKLYDDLTLMIKDKPENVKVEDAQKVAEATEFIIGYIRQTLPVINQEIIDRKYSEGHIFVRTFSIVDIFDVGILDKKLGWGGFAMLPWPSPLPAFTINKGLSDFGDAIFVRDMIEAMTAFFYFNYDDCIRKIITSLENCFIMHYKLPSKKQRSFLYKLKFLRPFLRSPKILNLIDEYIIEDNYDYKEKNLKILRQNIKYVYDMRNQIVHNELRCDPGLFGIYKKAIGTLYYIYQGFFIEEGKRAYIFSFQRQFLVIDENYSGLLVIKDIKDTGKEKIISTKEELDNAIFNNLEITKNEVVEFKNKSRKIPNQNYSKVPREILENLGQPIMLHPKATKKDTPRQT
ncbi:MAG: hypothetical protein A2534_04465 [Candidatus Magasanikbacteria bacterium RIFOXYD2_FULL_39_9]|nr:MAG: hypothetical protein A2534_04465 [Candidatus Magasanikbacteria bacterium RIFOXYD2_FULL_39_9]